MHAFVGIDSRCVLPHSGHVMIASVTTVATNQSSTSRGEAGKAPRRATCFSTPPPFRVKLAQRSFTIPLEQVSGTG